MKTTLATLKSFVRKNKDRLMIKCRGSFDSMTDGIEFNPFAQFRKAEPTTDCENHTLGIRGVWIVGGSRNSIEPYDDGKFSGLKVANCCAYFTVAVQKES